MSQQNRVRMPWSMSGFDAAALCLEKWLIACPGPGHAVPGEALGRIAKEAAQLLRIKLEAVPDHMLGAATADVIAEALFFLMKHLTIEGVTERLESDEPESLGPGTRDSSRAGTC